MTGGFLSDNLEHRLGQVELHLVAPSLKSVSYSD